METPLKRQIIRKLKLLSNERLLEVLDFIDHLQTKPTHKNAQSIGATEQEIIRGIEASGSIGIYYGEPNEVYSLDGGKPIVWEMPTIRAISKRRLIQYLNELVALAKTITQDVETDAHIPGDENQHARLTMYVPDEFEEQIDELVIQRVCDIFIETGYDIGVMVYEKSQLQSI